MNFDLIADGINVAPLLAAIEEHPELWRQFTIRQDYPGSAHHDTECIFILGPRSFTYQDYFQDISSLDYPALTPLMDALLPVLQPVLKQIGVTELGRVLIVRLRAGGVIDEHIDQGKYADYYSRFHIVISANAGCALVVGGQAQPMAAGEAWWFDHHKVHSGHNRGDTDRIHLIFDAVTPSY